MPVSLAEKVKSGAVEFDGSVGLVSIVVSGAVLSIVKVRLSGEPSTLPAVSVARLRTTYWPSAGKFDAPNANDQDAVPAAVRQFSPESANEEPSQ